MPRLSQIVLICIFTNLYLNCHGQKIHRFKLGLDLVKNTLPKEWHDHNVQKNTFNPSSNILKHNYGFWMGWYYNNAYSVRLSTTYFFQAGNVIPIEETPDRFPDLRMSAFWELSFGYNLLRKTNSDFSLWTYAGIGRSHSGKQSLTLMSYRAGHLREVRKLGWNAMALTTLQYDINRYIHVGMFVQYRYVLPTFQPLSAGVSIGVGF